MSADEQTHSKQLDRSGGGERVCVRVSFCHSHSSSRNVLIPIIAISANYLKTQLREAVAHFIYSAGENWAKRAKAEKKKRKVETLFKNFSSSTL